jgi:SAM-dependent methyltransferase
LPDSFIFDLPYARRFVEARQEWLRKVLPELKQVQGLQTAIDVGCGVGYFSGFLRDFGFRVVGVDGRKENVDEARQRHPEVEFHCVDVQDRVLQELGSFDLVFCFGLLYHLENPLSTLRNLATMTRKVALVEGIRAPGSEANFLLRVEDPSGDDNSLTPLALYPSESGLIKAAYRVGFDFVWRVTSFPEHEDFFETPTRERFRTILAASRVQLECPLFELAEDLQGQIDPWAKPPDFRHRMVGFARLSWRDKLRVLQRKLIPSQGRT